MPEKMPEKMPKKMPKKMLLRKEGEDLEERRVRRLGEARSLPLTYHN